MKKVTPDDLNKIPVPDTGIWIEFEGYNGFWVAGLPSMSLMVAISAADFFPEIPPLRAGCRIRYVADENKPKLIISQPMA